MSMISLLRDSRSKHKIDHQLGVLFDNTNEFKICMLDTAGNIIGWNLSAERLTGYTAVDVLGKNYSMFFSKEERRRNLLKKALATAAKTGQFNAEGIRVRKDGSHFWARTFITPMKKTNGGVKFFIVITRDVTGERALAQKREEYIGIASHELKNPITTLSLYSELLAKRLELDRDKENLHMLRDIQGQAARLTTLVDDLLVVGTLEQGKLELRKEVFDLNMFLKKLVRNFQKGTASHRVIYSGKLGRDVRADKDRIAQVCINLLANAVKYSPRAKKVQVRVRAFKGKCIIAIQDFGPGIATKDHRDIFTRFFRTADVEAGNIGGTGLGLYISKKIIKRHRERLWLESALGKGSTFYFTLSLA